MDWLTIASLVISTGALVIYLATARTPRPRRQTERKIQGNYAWTPTPARPADPDVIDRFAKALKSQSRTSS